jgi:hypothetical protein
MPTGKKRKLADENRMLQRKLTKEFFFGFVNGFAICVVCNKKISCFKEYNISRLWDKPHFTVR